MLVTILLPLFVCSLDIDQAPRPFLTKGPIDRLIEVIRNLLNPDCPPDNFQDNYVSKFPAEFDVRKWQKNRWFIMEQQRVQYQNDVDRFNCVSARYCPYNGSGIPNSLRQDDIDLSVYNSGCRRNSEGVVQDCNDPTDPGSPFANLGAIVSDAPKGQLNVIPTILPSFLKFTGPYWIMAFGCETAEEAASGTESSCSGDAEYTWGVVVGGEPRWRYPAAEGSDAVCSTRVSAYIGGLWIFNKERLEDFATSPYKDFIYAKIHDLGVTTSQLIPVDQNGCPEFPDPCPANLLV